MVEGVDAVREREMFFGVWDEDKEMIFGKVLESLDEAKPLADEWIENPRAGFIGVNWRRRKRKTGFAGSEKTSG